MKKILKSVAVIIVLGIGGILFILSHGIQGVRAFIVSSGSMEPTISTGSLIVTKSVQPSTLQNGDVITFIPPIATREFVTHRIAHITENERVTIIKTKGDANTSVDGWTVAGGGVVGKEVVSIPYLGYVFSFTQSKIGLVLFILIPAVYIIYTELEYIASIVKKRRFMSTPSATIALAMLVLLPGFVSTNALLADSATLINNTFTITPQQNASNPECTISVTGNAAGSQNSVTCATNASQIVTQSNTTTLLQTVITNTNSGENQIRH